MNSALQITPELSLAPVGASDFEDLVALRIAAMRTSLERLNRFDAGRARERFAASFSLDHSRHVLWAGQRVGLLTLRRQAAGVPWELDQLYLRPTAQAKGVGTSLLRWCCREADQCGADIHVTTLQRSDANRFYERHGFALVSEDEIERHYLRPSGLTSVLPADDAALAQALLSGQRRALAKVITLLESTRVDHRARADALLNSLLPHTGGAMRLGISGVPGVGKSTFIESLGLALIGQGHRVAVLAVDPSSSVSGGSILGDKTRMERLSVQATAYIRPSPASGTLGGVAEKTREAMLVCEAAGYDVVIVETVGVGQSETAVAGMTDMFVLMQLPNAGDDLQAIKKGVMELADLVVINKADLDPDAATRARAQISSALRVFSVHPHPAEPAHATLNEGRWHNEVMQLSALKGEGIDAFWAQVQRFQLLRKSSGEFASRRKQQSLAWMWDIVQARLQADFRHHPAVRAALPQTLHDVSSAKLAPSVAARTLLNLFEKPNP